MLTIWYIFVKENRKYNFQSSISSVKRYCTWYWVSGVAFKCSRRKESGCCVFCLVCKAGLLWLSLCSLVDSAGERLRGSRTENKESEYVYGSTS